MLSKNEYGKELFAFIIAILVIGAFVFFFGYALIVKPDINTAKEVTALFGGYVAAVLVYYFGQKQAQNLTNQAVEAKANEEKLKKAREVDKSTIAVSAEDYHNTMRTIENLKKRLNL